MVIDGAWQGMLGAGGQGIVALCFTLPFILLSGYAGQVADRFSKRRVAVAVKIAEVPIAILGFTGFLIGNLWITLGALIALTCQSSFFGPAKYGMIPELVDEGDLSRANGVINMLTNIAVILGMYLAGIISDIYAPQAAGAQAAVQVQSAWLPGAAMIAVAAAGLIAVLFLTALQPGDRQLKYDLNPVGTYIRALREMSRTPVLTVALAWGYFYLLAGLALAIIPEYTLVLGITREEASRLLAVLAVSIAVGCVIAGLVSGHRIEPRLVPVGAIGVMIFMTLLGVLAPGLTLVALLIFGAGFFAGFYLIPLQAMLQKYSPVSERGRFLGTANAISFGFLSIAGGVYWLIRPAFGNEPHRIFLLSAALMLLGIVFFMYRVRKTGFRRGAA